MKKVRLFAVAAAMGMFASTVAAAEPVVSTGYTTTWEGVEEIIKVDVGNKVVAPVTTIKVVKETRTTDTEYDVTNDALGFEEDANCWTSNGVAEDEDGDNYSDVQIYVNKDGANYLPGYYTSKEAALADFLADNHFVLAPGAEEVEANTAYYAKYANKTFADYEEVYAWAEEQGFVTSVYDEDGDLTKIYINEITVTDSKGKELANARYELSVPTTKRADETAKKAVVDTMVAGNLSSLGGSYVALPNYTAKENTLGWAAYVNGATTLTTIEAGDIVIVDEYKGELNVVAVIEPTGSATVAETLAYTAGWTTNPTTGVYEPIPVKGTAGKVTVYSLEKGTEVVKLMTVAPTKVGANTPYSKMIWDEEAGSFVKTADKFESRWFVGSTLTNNAGNVAGYWWANEYEEGKAAVEFKDGHLNVGANVLGLTVAPVSQENESGKWILTDRTAINGVNTKAEKITLQYATGKEIVVDAVELENGLWYPAFDSEETLLKVAAKLYENKVGVKFDNNIKYEALEGTNYSDGFETWYEATEAKANWYWSGYTHEGDLPETELMGPGSEACSYVVSVESETVDATVEASDVDTTEAGVKTMTLSAKVDGEVVATKEVKVVVAPRYERQYVNGKVAVLKAYYLDGKTLYSEYHYDWAAKTYTATFYANDGVTVVANTNGTL